MNACQSRRGARRLLVVFGPGACFSVPVRRGCSGLRLRALTLPRRLRLAGLSGLRSKTFNP